MRQKLMDQVTDDDQIHVREDVAGATFYPDE